MNKAEATNPIFELTKTHESMQWEGVININPNKIFWLSNRMENQRKIT
jgi:hypothetical protein